MDSDASRGRSGRRLPSRNRIGSRPGRLSRASLSTSVLKAEVQWGTPTVGYAMTLIPGHGGFMDRCDCQFIMGTAAFVVFSTFIEKPLVMMPLDRIISAAQTLTPEEQQALLDAVQGMVGGATGAP